jgi:hypothetical protein
MSEITYVVESVTSEDAAAIASNHTNGPDFLNYKGWISSKSAFLFTEKTLIF